MDSGFDSRRLHHPSLPAARKASDGKPCFGKNKTG
jgi:hypothetical protein